MQKVLHPHITNNTEVCGGSPIIVGTRFPVRSVVTYVLRYGLTPEELSAKFSFLTLAQIHDALAYFYDNQEEINTDLRQNSEDTIRPQAIPPSQ